MSHHQHCQYCQHCQHCQDCCQHCRNVQPSTNFASASSQKGRGGCGGVALCYIIVVKVMYENIKNHLELNPMLALIDYAFKLYQTKMGVVEVCRLLLWFQILEVFEKSDATQQHSCIDITVTIMWLLLNNHNWSFDIVCTQEMSLVVDIYLRQTRPTASSWRGLRKSKMRRSIYSVNSAQFDICNFEFATNNSYLQTMNHSWWNTQLLFHAFGFKTLWPSSDVNTCPNHITSCQPADSHVQNLCLCSQRKAACPYVERGKSRLLLVETHLIRDIILRTKWFLPPQTNWAGAFNPRPPPLIRAMPDRNHFFSGYLYMNKPCHYRKNAVFV